MKVKINAKALVVSMGIVLWILSIVSVYYYMHKKYVSTENIINEDIEYVDSLKAYNKFYSESNFNELKEKNKSLYDSLKKYKDRIDYLVQFSYEKTSTSGKVVITKKENNDTTYAEPKDFVYESEPNDTFEYKITINSVKEPNYYKIDAKFKDKFTIVNKFDENGNNHISIQGDDKGNVSDVTVYKKKKTTKFIDRFAIGPAITVGYDPFNKKMAAVCGVSLTFKIN